LLLGRAKCCGIRIPARYILVEAAGGLLSLALIEAVVRPMPANTSLVFATAVYALWFALAIALIAAAFIDLEHMYIPDSISIGAIVIGLSTYWLRPPLSLIEAACSAAAGFAVVWLVFGVLYRLIRGRTGMGMGDAKLLAVAGAWFGWQGTLFTLVAGAVQGTLVAAIILIIKGQIDEPAVVEKERELLLSEVAAIEDPLEREAAEKELEKDPIFEKTTHSVAGARIPFGPFLVLAMIEYLLIGEALLEEYWIWAGL